MVYSPVFDDAEVVQLVPEQNPFNLEAHNDNINHNDNLGEENDNDVHLVQLPDNMVPDHGIMHDVHHIDEDQNQVANEVVDDMESDDDDFSLDGALGQL